MYSPKGWTCRLSYVATGPRPGSHWMRVLRSLPVSGATTAPITVGAPTARTASSMTSAASAFAYGSMSEEFSGHRTKSGCGSRFSATAWASSRVRAAWLSSTARRWALKSRPRRGTLPWIAATVAVPSSAESSTSGSAASAPVTGTSTASAAATSGPRGRAPVRGGVPPEASGAEAVAVVSGAGASETVAPGAEAPGAVAVAPEAPWARRARAWRAAS